MAVSTNQIKTVDSTVKKGLATTEFYLSTFVAIAGSVVQFLPANVADSVVKVTAAIAAVLAVVGYTGSRTFVKANAGSTTTTVGVSAPDPVVTPLPEPGTTVAPQV